MGTFDGRRPAADGQPPSWVQRRGRTPAQASGGQHEVTLLPLVLVLAAQSAQIWPDRISLINYRVASTTKRVLHWRTCAAFQPLACPPPPPPPLEAVLAFTSGPSRPSPATGLASPRLQCFTSLAPTRAGNVRGPRPMNRWPRVRRPPLAISTYSTQKAFWKSIPTFAGPTWNLVWPTVNLECDFSPALVTELAALVNRRRVERR